MVATTPVSQYKSTTLVYTGVVLMIASAASVFRGYRKLPAAGSLAGLAACWIGTRPVVLPSRDETQVAARAVAAGCRFDAEQPILTWDGDAYTVTGSVRIDRRTVVSPVCQAGYNRSQIVYQILKERGVVVSRPHGTTFGPAATRHRKGYATQPIWSTRNDPFVSSFGRDRVLRVGELATDDESLKAYFDRIIDNGGHVIIASQALEHFVDELMTFAGDRRLDNIRVTSIAADDPHRTGDVRAYPAFIEAMKGILVLSSG